MKSEAKVFWGLAIYMALMSVVYPIATWRTQGYVEPVGTVVIILTLLFLVMIGGYLHLTARKMDPRLEDRPDGTIAEGAGDYGFFAPSSPWPFWCALVTMMMFLGWIFGYWIMLIGVGVGVWAVAGWTMQFYKGDYAH